MLLKIKRIKRLYEEGYSLRKIARLFHVDGTTILYHMKKHKIKRRGRLAVQTGKFGAAAQNWKGGRRLNSRGYYVCYAPDHPHARGKYVMEHRLKMEKKLGRYLDPKETVHHKNGIKTDNRLRNLELLPSRGAHQRIHMIGNSRRWGKK